MELFNFVLSPGYSLRQNARGYFLTSGKPIRALQLNHSLFNLIELIRNHGALSDFIARHPSRQMTGLLPTLLSLTAKGYLGLAEPPVMETCPYVSVIIPVFNQPRELEGCLASLANLDYPMDHLEIIVVDDGSPTEVAAAIASPAVRVIRLKTNSGPATCRNTGAEQARGDILAFIDADCEASERWLKELVPFFQVPGMGIAGGYIEGYYHRKLLDRYEAVGSSLNMGNRHVFEGKSSSYAYVPTANMLVDRAAFDAAGGFKAGMYLGEDVDLCWRLRESGYYLLYTPFGRITHKHPSRLDKLVKRVFEYGTSEALLYKTHPEKKKMLSLPVYSWLSFLVIMVSLIILNPYPLVSLPFLAALSLYRTNANVKKMGIELPLQKISLSVLRSYLGFYYSAFFHLIRYYLVPFIILGILWHPVWIFGALALVYASAVDYYFKKPALLYPVYLFFYTTEHLAYQIGVFWGCVKARYFGSYLVTFKRA